MSITIDREGAARLFAAQQMADGRALRHALSCAAAGDFTALAELVGTREVERAPFATEAQVREAIAEAAEAARNLPAPHAETLQRVLAPICRRTQGKCFCGAHGGSVVMAVPAPAPAPDFRKGDTVRFDMRSFIIDSEPWYEDHPILKGWRIRIVHPRSGDARDVYTESLVLTHRRHFRAGERCPVVAVGQFLRTRNGITIRITERDGDAGWFGVWRDCGIAIRTYVRADEASQVPLGEDWTAPEAVEVKP